jgi:cysteine desulfurase
MRLLTERPFRYDSRMPREVYLDWAATAPPEPSWLDAGRDASIEFFSNPSSAHSGGARAKAALDSARESLLESLGGAGKAVFCSGATEANEIALGGILLRPGEPLVAVSAIEHPSIHEACKGLARRGLATAVIGVGPDGIVRPEDVRYAMEKKPRLVAVMAVNNETGAIQDLSAIVEAVRSADGGKDARVHADATQAFGKLPFDPGALGIDSAAFSAHKLGGPRGVGLLWTLKDIDVLWKGGGQEDGMRPGTENLGGAVSFALAAESALAMMNAERERVSALASSAMEGILALGGKVLPAARKIGDVRYSPWIVQAALPGISAEVLVRFLSDRGVLVSTGSACSSKRRDRRVLAAMGIDEKTALSAFRVSFGRTSTGGEVDAFLAALSDAPERLR